MDDTILLFPKYNSNQNVLFFKYIDTSFVY